MCAPTCSEYDIEVPAPKDAENRKVPLDTKVMYNAGGDELEVRWFTFSTGPYGPGWSVKVYDQSDGDQSDDRGYTLPLDSMYLEKPDSWEKLEEDLSEISKGSVCHYFHKGGSNDCEGCPANGARSCWPTMARDVKSRIRKLRGEDDA